MRMPTVTPLKSIAIRAFDMPEAGGPAMACDVRTRQILRFVYVNPAPRRVFNDGSVIPAEPGECYVVPIVKRDGSPLVTEDAPDVYDRMQTGGG
jgi:hypothetical protein